MAASAWGENPKGFGFYLKVKGRLLNGRMDKFQDG
jgi:hypothetical protein